MKQYPLSSRKTLTIHLTVCVLIALAGAILKFSDVFLWDIDLGLATLCFSGILGCIFSIFLLFTARKRLILDEESISFPNETKFKNPLLFGDVKKISVRTTAGEAIPPVLQIVLSIMLCDGVISTQETSYYTFHLKNGQKFETTFFQYGKKQEKEIVDFLHKKIPYQFGNMV